MGNTADANIGKRLELVRVAESMIDGTLNLIEGARRICSLRHSVGDPDSDVFMPIRAFESETDHFPLGDVRHEYSTAYLKQLDEEANGYIADAGEYVLASCREIVREFSPS